ncbi:MAG: capsule biosynthesis protein CapD [Verrucomicrobia bacterium CG_4_10_14_3_um_filter_43_23]|nr:MAG: capsule biosynthesis protein CapD [Verrucomicrobia bacterium CG22_combo_CG10-13_8_21_14_all_43_17]PIX58055.1 MAG: capsule biosynthesis protein CapD [Verrucomicrobia bacterium CG_4_10_14_3_um_filter_43_23]PIY62290.1 MAG: capsule biosynthesis protein CapD [Verrucomicrobia bacterium CG_4_10_14_0_8_um_filter_43_34]PJA43771.1 MAG: capsule biosynthesis protein CapD [Verrucomicrobia bacterium CG_4_9_14_3_um_filter_43_20]
MHQPKSFRFQLRFFALLFIYTCCCTFSLYLAYYLRYDFIIPEDVQIERWESLIWFIPFELLLLYMFGQFNGLLSYFRLPDLYRIFSAFTIASTTLLFLWFLFGGNYVPPRGVILADYILSILSITIFRVALRIYRERFLNSKSHTHTAQRVAIIGAGDVGATLVADLLMRRSLGMRPIIFLDDNRKKIGSHIHGIPVVGTPDNLEAIKNAYMIDKVILALPSSASQRIRKITESARALNIKAELVPSWHDIASGRIKASRIRSVELEDILGREPVKLDSEHIRDLLKSKSVLVTGAGGSIGSELCRQIAAKTPNKLILVEQSEGQLFQIEQELIEDGYKGIIFAVVADILDEPRMNHIFKQYQPSIVFHAAAHKHVPMMEYQPHEAIKNNVLGTDILTRLAAKFHVERFVFISTDKAINPTNVMGATKRMAEIITQSNQCLPDNKTNFMAVRFGNVLGSSGSVIPIFKKQIAAGGPITVTHPEVTRYFMTIPEAVGLVLQCATQGNGGEIFILDMGQPMKIVDVARQLAELSGFKPEVDIEIKYVGLRPGEKLFEELLYNKEEVTSTNHPRILRLKSQPQAHAAIQATATWIRDDLYHFSANDLKKRLQDFVPEYSPFIDQ